MPPTSGPGASHKRSNRGVGQRRRDREWPTPAATRHVWVAQEDVRVPPLQGFVMDWRRYSYRWWALVLVVETPKDAAPVILMQWLPVERLTPIKSDPNDGRARRL